MQSHEQLTCPYPLDERHLYFRLLAHCGGEAHLRCVVTSYITWAKLDDNYEKSDAEEPQAISHV
jgi:hypothetical protein